MRASSSHRLARSTLAATLALSTLTATAWTNEHAGAPSRPRTAARTALNTGGILNAVSATSSRNAWAVGTTNSAKTLVVHWNGRAWRRQTSPDPGGGGGLAGVAASSARNAWAVGSDARGRAIILHSNGRAWRQVSAPHPGAGSSYAGVAIVSPKNVWAVGSYFRAASVRTLIAHWDGTTWKQLHGPAGALSGVTAVSARNVWAVGDRFTLASNAAKSLVLHWNGSLWRRVALRTPVGNGAGLAGVTASSARRVWAVGCSGCGIGGAASSLIERWNGTGWVRSSAAHPPGGDLTAVATASSRRAWAVGGYYPHFGVSDTTHTLVQRWNGSAWTRAASPSPGRTAVLRGVSAVTGHDAWAVGGYRRGAGNGFRTLILRWNGHRWK